MVTLILATGTGLWFWAVSSETNFRFTIVDNFSWSILDNWLGNLLGWGATCHLVGWFTMFNLRFVHVDDDLLLSNYDVSALNDGLSRLDAFCLDFDVAVKVGSFHFDGFLDNLDVKRALLDLLVLRVVTSVFLLNWAAYGPFSVTSVQITELS